MQVDEPLALYHRPRNLFVAGFIGSPPMNFFRGRIRRAEGRLLFAEEGGTPGSLLLELPDEALKASGAGYERAVVLGIRPEDIHEAAPEASSAGSRIEATVELFEPMGAEAYLHLRGGHSGFVARVRPTQPYVINQKVRLSFDASRAHLFDAATEASLMGQDTP